jgi:hypothetical protein
VALVLAFFFSFESTTNRDRWILQIQRERAKKEERETEERDGREFDCITTKRNEKKKKKKLDLHPHVSEKTEK